MSGAPCPFNVHGCGRVVQPIPQLQVIARGEELEGEFIWCPWRRHAASVIICVHIVECIFGVRVPGGKCGRGRLPWRSDFEADRFGHGHVVQGREAFAFDQEKHHQNGNDDEDCLHGVHAVCTVGYIFLFGGLEACGGGVTLTWRVHVSPCFSREARMLIHRAYSGFVIAFRCAR